MAAADDWDPRDPAVLGDQIAAYDDMRARCPVAHSDYLGWSVFRHADVVTVIGDHETYSSAVSRHPAVPNGFDPPQHGPYRRIVEGYFTPEHMLAFDPVCRQVAQELVAELPRGEQVEFISAFALEYALEAQRAWLGWPAYTVDALRHWTARNHRATLHRDREALDAVATDFDTTVHRVLRDQREQLRTSSTERLPAPVETPASFPATTPVSTTDTAATVTALLLDETIDGVPLRDNELVSILRNWTVGELGTISASVGILVAYLAGHPNLQAELRGAPEKLPAAIEEILRMHSPLIANRRVATRDTELGGRRISAGERVNVNWASANRDEARFGNPDDYQPELNAADNLLYGRGIHDCPGAPLARLELRIVVEELLAATNSIDTALAGAPDFASYPASGYRTLPMTLS